MRPFYFFKITLFSFIVISIHSSCTIKPFACVELDPNKETYKVNETILFDISCAADFHHISFDFGDGDKQSVDTKESSFKKEKKYPFAGEYRARIVFYSKNKKKDEFVERFIKVIP